MSSSEDSDDEDAAAYRRSGRVRTWSFGSAHYVCAMQFRLTLRAWVVACTQLYVWGSGLDGQLGLGDSHICKSPAPIATLPSHIVSVSCGHFHTACVSAAGDLFTWGRSTWGRLGRPVDEVCRTAHCCPSLARHTIV